MKKMTWIATLCLVSLGGALAQNADDDLVKKTLSYYLDGGTNNDFNTLKKAFHKEARMKYIRQGEYHDVNAIEFFEKAIKPGPKQNRKTSIQSVSIAGNAASAILKIEYETFYFTDYMNLLKIKGEWKVVNKIFYRDKK